MIREANEEAGEEQRESFQWSSRKQHLLFFFGYVMSYSAGCSVISQSISGEKDKAHKAVQLLLLTISVGAPILFLQNSIGQYTRNTCLILGEMFPIFYGIGYCMLFISLCDLAKQMFYTTKLICYIFVVICNTFPAWMKCYKQLFKNFPNCISRKDIDHCATHSNSHEPCFKPHSVILSAEIFKDGIVFGRIKMDGQYIDGSEVWSSDTFFVVAFCISNTAVLFIFLILGSSKSAKVFYTLHIDLAQRINPYYQTIPHSFAWYYVDMNRKNLTISLQPLKAGVILCLGLLVSIGVTLVIQPGITRGLNELKQHLLHPSLFELETWVSAFTVMVKSLRLAEGGHILFGSYIPANKPDFWRFLVLTAVYIAAVSLFTIYYHLFLGLLLSKLNMEIDDIITETEENIIFVLFPTFMGILPSCYFLSLVFFVSFVLLSFFSMVVKIIVLEQGLTKYFNLSEYFVYVRYIICVLISIVSFCMEKNEISISVKNLQNLFGFSCIVVLAVQQIMVIVYGIQNVFDDIEYIMKIRLKGLMQLMWIVTPLFCFMSAASIASTLDFTTNMALKIVFIVILLTPVLISFIKQFFLFAKRKNLIGLLRPTERYGPPNVEDRILRVLYNTRLMVRYRRYKEPCPHECLLNSNAVKMALEEELKQIKNFENELKFKSKNKDWEERISLQFRKHKKYLLKFIQKYEANKEVKFEKSTDNGPQVHEED